jgi:hypothetical protein
MIELDYVIFLCIFESLMAFRAYISYGAASHILVGRDMFKGDWYYGKALVFKDYEK